MKNLIKENISKKKKKRENELKVVKNQKWVNIVKENDKSKRS